MKRMHIHLSVDDLNKSIDFYSTLFGNSPSVEHKDYAKWNMNNPAVNFAISKRGSSIGINHLGIQVDSDEELTEINQRFNQAEIATSTQKEVSCCYAQSNKHWAIDPQGIAWETFYSLGNIPVFGENVKTDSTSETPCCQPPNVAHTSRLFLPAGK